MNDNGLFGLRQECSKRDFIISTFQDFVYLLGLKWLVPTDGINLKTRSAFVFKLWFSLLDEFL